MKRKSKDRSVSRVSGSFTCLRGTNSVVGEHVSDQSSYRGGGPIEKYGHTQQFLTVIKLFVLCFDLRALIELATKVYCILDFFGLRK